MSPELWTLPAELAEVDCLLDHPALLEPLLDQLDPVRERPSVPAAPELRLIYLKEHCQLADRALIQEVSARSFIEDLARIAEAQSRATARLMDTAKERRDAMRKELQAQIDRVKQVLADLRTVIQSRAAIVGERIRERVVSLADRDARPIKKGNLGQSTQFGCQVQIIEAESSFVTDYTVERGNPSDVEALGPALDCHIAPVGRPPALRPRIGAIAALRTNGTTGLPPTQDTDGGDSETREEIRATPAPRTPARLSPRPTLARGRAEVRLVG